MWQILFSFLFFCDINYNLSIFHEALSIYSIRRKLNPSDGQFVIYVNGIPVMTHLEGSVVYFDYLMFTTSYTGNIFANPLTYL